MKRSDQIFYLSAVAMAIAQISFAQAMGTETAAAIAPRPNSAIVPALYNGLMKAHADNVKVAKKGRVNVLFMGDSIMDMWRSPGIGAAVDGGIPFGGKAVFEKHFGNMRVANFGISGDTTQGVLWRLQNGEGEGYQPKAVMLMIGTNNTERNTPPEIAMGVASVVFELRKDFPDAKILLLGIFPRNAAGSPIRAQIGEINRIISTLDDGQHVFFMDIGPKFLAADGSIPVRVMADGLHPTSKGYEIWADAVQDKLASLMQ